VGDFVYDPVTLLVAFERVAGNRLMDIENHTTSATAPEP
jgi:hypothetical protein